MSRNIPAAESAPHSWDLEHWPQSVYPHTTGRARYMVRSHKNDLLAAGALSRVGRELIVLGARYTKWLESHSTSVPDFEIAANRKCPSKAAA